MDWQVRCTCMCLLLILATAADAINIGTGVEFRLAGSPERSKGRFEVSIDGVWGTVCNSSWNTPDATVLCRQLGFAGGSVSRETYGSAPIKMYTTRMACLGVEKHLLSCPHTGWTGVSVTDRRCPDHSFDVSITCHGPVRLVVAEVRNPVHGPLMYYVSTYWSLVCDKGFDDFAAKLACVSMGFVDGRAICCSAYGPGRFISAFKMSCAGNETSIEQCVKSIACKSSHYVSVVCFRQNQIPIAEDYRFSVHREVEAHGLVTVQHYGITGRICYQHWSDFEAKVLCKSLGYKAGVAYLRRFISQRPAAAPYMVSNVTCDGTEADVSQCQFNGRLNIGDCAEQHMAGALCLNTSADVEYRLAGGGPNYGRVEVGVDGVWGTICSIWWGYPETRVLCRQLGFVLGGMPIRMGNITQASGTIWMSHLQCEGTENSLHNCRHAGFDTEVSELHGRYPDGRIVDYPGCNAQRRSDAAALCFETTTSDTTPETTSRTTSQTTSEKTLETMSQTTSEKAPETTSQTTPQTTSQTTSEKTPETTSQTTSETTSETTSQTTSETTSETTSVTTLQIIDRVPSSSCTHLPIIATCISPLIAYLTLIVV